MYSYRVFWVGGGTVVSMHPFSVYMSNQRTCEINQVQMKPIPSVKSEAVLLSSQSAMDTARLSAAKSSPMMETINMV